MTESIPAATATAKPSSSESDQISQNINAVLDFYAREDEKMGYWQRGIERISSLIGQPAFLGLALLVVILWIVGNTAAHMMGMKEIDPAPFFWLQGALTLAALLTTTIVLIKQNRLAQLEEQRAHLDLKVTLLTEQKAAKMIDLLEELRRDLPNVKNRPDAQAAALQQSMNPDLVLAALDERALPDATTVAVNEADDQAGSLASRQ